MGMLFRIFAPKPVKQARRLAHPVSSVTPRPVRNVKRAAAKAVNPVGAVGDALETGAVRAARSRSRRRRVQPKASDPAWRSIEGSESGDVPADFTPGDVLSAWTPITRAASQVPILNAIKAFLVLEGARLNASRELADAVAEDDRLEALALLTALYDRETPMVSDLAGSGRLDQVTDPDVAHCWSWTAAWIAAAKQEWPQRITERDALIESMDPAVLETVANKVAQRLEAITKRADDAGS